MDVLVSGSERPPRDRSAARRWPPPRWGVVLLVVLLLAGFTGVTAVRQLRAGSDLARFGVDARSFVQVRPRGRDGVLLLGLSNTGDREVRVQSLRLALAGVDAAPLPVDRVVAPRARVQVELPMAVRSCAALGVRGELRIAARVGSRTQEVAVPIGGASPLRADVFGAACPPTDSPDVVALEVHTATTSRETSAEGASGTVVLELLNDGADLSLVQVRAEAPGVIFSGAGLGPMLRGQRSRLRLPFYIPSCAVVHRTGRVVVTVRGNGIGPRELGFRATEDEEAGTVRDVDLDAALRACNGAVPVPLG